MVEWKRTGDIWWVEEAVTAAGSTVWRLPPDRWPKPPLNRLLIIERATAMIDRDGVASLTMRSLGSALGVEAMSLYRHVNGRADLLEGISESLMGAIKVQPGPPLGRSHSWRSFLQDLAHEVRRVALVHPAAFPLVVTRHPGAPWLRPPLPSLPIVEAILHGLLGRGFTDYQAVATYRAFSSFLLGHLLVECPMASASTPLTHKPHDVGGTVLRGLNGRCDLDGYPTLAQLQPQLIENHPEADFEQALEHLLRRIAFEVETPPNTSVRNR